MKTSKTILFFCNDFFNYREEIYIKLKEYGYNVLLFNERPSNKALVKFVLRFFPHFSKIITYPYYKKILKKIKNEIKIDIVFFIKCEIAPMFFLRKLKKDFNPKFILYLWDSINHTPDYKTKLKFFDEIFSFDKVDCQKYKKIQFVPLFYLDTYQGREQNKNIYDFCFVGTIHSDRLKLLTEIKSICEKNDLKYYYYMFLPTKWAYYFYKIKQYKIFKGYKINDFKYERLSSKEVANLYSKSKIIIDAEKNNQNGLTIRTFEVLASEKKLITTNISIKEYDFYLEDNIYVIENEINEIPKSFFLNKFIKIDESFINEYSLDKWIQKVIGKEDLI